MAFTEDFDVINNDTALSVNKITSYSFSDPLIKDLIASLYKNTSVQTDINCSVDHYNNLQHRILNLEEELKRCEKIIKNLKTSKN